MRITLLARNDIASDPRARALDASLRASGHEIRYVVGTRPPAGGANDTSFVPPDGSSSSVLARAASRVRSSSARERTRVRRFVAAVQETAPELIYPTTAAMVPLASDAVAASAAVARAPHWPAPRRRDLVWLAPEEPQVARPTGGAEAPFHTPSDDRAGSRPTPGRHAGCIALAYARTDRSPGRYLEAALERAGLDVVVCDGRVDTERLPADLLGLIFVESPYPPIEMVGPPPTYPILFWVHHGEHHLAANLRLARRYGADAVLLAHSWHLAHRFAVPVHRFPFAIDEQLFDPSRPWGDRRFDAAMVGAHLREGGPYQRRQELVRTAETTLGVERTAFLEGVAPERMADVYGNARVVLNEGGTRHFPITMRVFEAIAAGALLLTDPVPGLAQLFSPDEQFHAIGADLATQLQNILASTGSPQVAGAGLQRAQGRHTYDHRVDELMELLAVTEPGQASVAATVVSEGPDQVLVDDVEVQRILTDEAWLAPEHLPDREIWRLDEVRGPVKPASFEALAADLQQVDEELLGAARRYLYLTGPCRGLEDYLALRHPAATVTVHDDVRRIDLHAEGYRRRQPEEMHT